MDRKRTGLKSAISGKYNLITLIHCEQLVNVCPIPTEKYTKTPLKLSFFGDFRDELPRLFGQKACAQDLAGMSQSFPIDAHSKFGK